MEATDALQAIAGVVGDITVVAVLLWRLVISDKMVEYYREAQERRVERLEDKLHSTPTIQTPTQK